MGVRLYVCPIDGVQQPTLTELRKACAEIEAVYAISIEWKNRCYGSLCSIFFGSEEGGGLVVGVDSEGDGDFVSFHEEGGDWLTYLRWVRAIARYTGDQLVVCGAGGGPFTVQAEASDEALQSILDEM